jgi:hypothetical protein
MSMRGRAQDLHDAECCVEEFEIHSRANERKPSVLHRGFSYIPAIELIYRENYMTIFILLILLLWFAIGGTLFIYWGRKMGNVYLDVDFIGLFITMGVAGPFTYFIGRSVYCEVMGVPKKSILLFKHKP